MLEIGITGGIGSGKTIVCKILEVFGYPVFYADKEAKRVMTTDVELMENLKVAFGELTYTSGGELNRKYLSEIVFNNQKKLDKLNELVHPATIRAYQRWAKQQRSDLVFKEAALLFESGSYKLSDVNILVSSPKALRIKRVMLRDGLEQQQVMSRIDKQMGEEQKRMLADYILINDERQALLPQVLALREKLIKEKNGSVRQ